MQKVSQQEQSAASNKVGLISKMIGEEEITRKRAMFIFVPMAFISTSRR
jgi:hypothetical protein